MSLRSQLDRNLIDAYHGMDIPWLVAQWAERAPDKPFLIWEPFDGEGATITYADLAQRSRRLAAGLHQRGVESGDFVLIHMNNSPEFVLAWFACAHLGAVAVATNTRSVGRDMAYFASHTEAVCALTQPEFAAMIRSSCPDLRFLAVTDTNSGAPAAVDPGWDAVAFNDLFADDATVATLPSRPIDAMADLGVQFTSGTTSRPKAVLWTHANGLFAGKVSALHMRLRHDDRTLVFLPLFHTNAQAYSMLGTLWTGGTMVVQPRLSGSRFWDVSLKHRITWVSTIPFLWKAIEQQPVPEHHYRFWGSPAYMPSVAEHYGVDMVGWWGMTETLTHGIVTDVDHPGPAKNIGRVAPEFEIQIREPGAGPDGPFTERGDRGSLYIRGVRGVSLFKEYYRNPEATEGSFDDDGWFDTGDVIRIDDEGHLFFSDRDKDMLKVGAENVAASEVETVVMMSGMAMECAVVGQPHRMLDEVPVVFVIPSPQAAALADDTAVEKAVIEFCAENLADFKVPRAVHLVDELPRSTLEKVAKNELRDRLEPIES